MTTKATMTTTKGDINFDSRHAQHMKEKAEAHSPIKEQLTKDGRNLQKWGKN